MVDLIFADSHNMVAYLEKSEDNDDFAEIVDFLNASPIRYALTVSLTVYVSYIKQFWSTAKIKTVNNETQIRAKVDGKTIVIIESSVRRDLYFNDEDGITCLTNTKTFENLQLMGSKSTAWNEFGTNIASAVICLAKKQKFNFSKLVFDVFNDEYDTPSHTKKVFANMRRKGKDFSGIVTPLFATMLIQSQAVEGEGSGQPTEPQHTPTTALPSHVEPIPIGIGSCGSPRRQDTMGDRPAQTRFERLSKQSNEPPLSRVNTLESGEDSMKLQELMDLCTKLSDRVLDLENVKDAQALEIKKLKKRIKKLESKKKSRTLQLKRRLFKVMIESSTKKSLGDQEDSSKQGRNKIDQYERISCINMTIAEPVTTASAPVTTGSVSVSTVEPSTPPPTTTTTTPIEDEDLTIAQTLMKMKSEKPKAKGVTMQEPTQRLQEELDEEVRLERERKEEASKAANIAEWDDVQAMMDADYELATKIQEQERKELTIEERSKLFVELMNERNKHFARLIVEEQRRNPPTKTQKRNLMSTYLKNMVGYKHTQLKNRIFKEIQMLFEKEMKRVNIFIDMDAELVKGSETLESKVNRVVPELAAGSSKRDAKEELNQESSKRQKTSESSKLAEEPKVKEADELSQEELQQMMIIVLEQGMNSLVKEKFNSTEPTDDKEREIWVELKRLFEPDTDDELWKLQKHIHDVTWRLYDSCGVHHVSIEKGINIYMLVEKEYSLSRGTLTLMLVTKLLMDQDNEMSRELLRKIFMQIIVVDPLSLCLFVLNGSLQSAVLCLEYAVKAVTPEQNKSSRISTPRSGSTSAAMRSHQKRDSGLQSSTSIRASPSIVKQTWF
ncbi:hypothetical protein Tco_1255062 [Tanacetum coccineum]